MSLTGQKRTASGRAEIGRSSRRRRQVRSLCNNLVANERMHFIEQSGTEMAFPSHPYISDAAADRI
jgi:hypothetical protein